MGSLKTQVINILGWLSVPLTVQSYLTGEKPFGLLGRWLSWLGIRVKYWESIGFWIDSHSLVLFLVLGALALGYFILILFVARDVKFLNGKVYADSGFWICAALSRQVSDVGSSIHFSVLLMLVVCISVACNSVFRKKSKDCPSVFKEDPIRAIVKTFPSQFFYSFVILMVSPAVSLLAALTGIFEISRHPGDGR